MTSKFKLAATIGFATVVLAMLAALIYSINQPDFWMELKQDDRGFFTYYPDGLDNKYMEPHPRGLQPTIIRPAVCEMEFLGDLLRESPATFQGARILDPADTKDYQRRVPCNWIEDEGEPSKSD